MSEEEAQRSWGLSLRSDEHGSRANLTPLLPGPHPTPSTHWYLDFHAVPVSETPPPGSLLISLNSSHLFSEAHHSLLTKDLFTALTNAKPKGVATILRLLFSLGSGTPVRSDFLEYRLKHSPVVQSVRTFLKPLTPVIGTTASIAHKIASSQDFASLLARSLGGIIARGPCDPVIISHSLDEEVKCRLSFPWLVSTPVERKRILWVQGRANIEASHQFYQASYALGITLVVADVPGHWMEDPDGPHAHFREAFVPLNIDGDGGLAQRIIDVVRAYPHRIDGIVSISDVRLPHVARACELLGLATEVPDAYATAGDKGKTRVLEGGDDSFVLATAADLEAELQKRGQLEFPMIVKPCTGWNSDCVVRVRDLSELRAAVERASARHASSPAKNAAVVVEPYIDGPEVDANFVVLDGVVLFCDITDDFPCSGDLVEGTLAANFMETLMDVPSALPEDERTMLRDSLQRSIRQCGFRSGIFHCEARVRGSRAHYRPWEDSGILDLRLREDRGGGMEPSCYLHEVNARPPGYVNCVAALLAHGVDYYAIRLLLALGPGENERVSILAKAFLSGSPQLTLGIVVLPPTREGVMGSEDAVLGFLGENPDLREHVVWHQTVRGRGEVVQGPDSNELFCVGYIIVASRNGRKECLELAQRVRERFDYRLLDE